MIGRTAPAVTLQNPAFAVPTNYLKVDLRSFHQPRELLSVEIGGRTETGLRERSAFRFCSSSPTPLSPQLIIEASKLSLHTRIG
jgi:hypothetical protein